MDLCGGTYAVVAKRNDTVTFSDFAGDIQGKPKGKKYVFLRSNYDEVVQQMTELAADHRRRNTQNK